MGMPFYGRSWQDKRNNRALQFIGVQNIFNNTPNIKILEGSDLGFEYNDTVKVTVYYDNPASLIKKADVYYSAGVKNIGFWRIGQESKEIWNLITTEIDKL